MSEVFALTQKQQQANVTLGSATHVLLWGGSRSGKTLLICRAIVARALKAKGSRHAIFRFRLAHCTQSVALDTFPRMMDLCYPGMPWDMNRQFWYATINGSEVWFSGLDDKLAVEKVLGKEFSTIFLNECSQIPYQSREVVMTRLAQQAPITGEGQSGFLPLRMWYDENPPDRNHWTYRLFLQKVHPETRAPLPNPHDYAQLQVNPEDNRAHLGDYIDKVLRTMSSRNRRRFLEGEFREANPNALFDQSDLDKWRVLDSRLPDFQRVVIAVDPSGSGDADAADHDAIGIVVAALGTDGNGYLLEDLTVKAGPNTWGRIATAAYDRHAADVVVAEINYGGAMVRQVIQAARANTPFREVRASRGKVVRAEPISTLVEQGKVRMVGYYPELEDELSSFTTSGYLGEHSPNRADAFVWAFAELFPGMVAERPEPRPEPRVVRVSGPGSWMAS